VGKREGRSGGEGGGGGGGRLMWLDGGEGGGRLMWTGESGTGEELEQWKRLD
jgi:hypothetical protein